MEEDGEKRHYALESRPPRSLGISRVWVRKNRLVLNSNAFLSAYIGRQFECLLSPQKLLPKQI